MEQKEVHVFFVNKEVIIYNQPIDEIISLVERGLKENPSDTKLLLIRIQILSSYQNNYKQALIETRYLLQLDPLSIDARLNLVQMMIDYTIGSNKQCEQLLQECINIDKDYWRIYLVQIMYFKEVGISFNFIMAQLKNLLVKYPDNLWLMIQYWFWISYEMNADQQNIKLDTIYQSNYLNYDLMKKLSLILYNLGQKEQSIEYSTKALELNPISFHSLCHQANILKYNNQFKECIVVCQKALEKYPNYHKAYMIMGQAFQQTNQYQSSIDSFKKYLELKNDDPFLYYNLLINYQQKLNDYHNIKYYCQKAFKLYPQDIRLNYCFLQAILNTQIGKFLKDFQLNFNHFIQKYRL